MIATGRCGSTTRGRNLVGNRRSLARKLLRACKFRVGLETALTEVNALILVFLVHSNAQRDLDYVPDDEAHDEDPE